MARTPLFWNPAEMRAVVTYSQKENKKRFAEEIQELRAGWRMQLIPFCDFSWERESKFQQVVLFSKHLLEFALMWFYTIVLVVSTTLGLHIWNYLPQWELGHLNLCLTVTRTTFCFLTVARGVKGFQIQNAFYTHRAWVFLSSSMTFILMLFKCIKALLPSFVCK